MNFKEIKELIEILDQSSLTEINIEDKGNIVNLKKEKETEIITPQVSQQPMQQVAPQQAVTPIQSTSESSEEGSAAQENDNLETINAPMVGTFYKSPSPEESPYVQVGDAVSNESTVCILEAMKLFNEIQAEVTGEIAEILVEDGQMVEYGQPLFKVK
ncbi:MULTISPECIES: acetyl-CoA carboxylase biotin carboxyl carrier protein [Staphylococcus]|jgi:acetyl-CoA carboxylase biotin carboxyl carrier protein|uniref:Biotin carboxyl carrier protein of acetyl-CoA carboxylase n=1 Tax=Staphylococcus nepalensis TaxID=214473 RepID=A0A291JKT6_9STAP|nr:MULTISPECIES: acetyl-CoA carboxylase biotin carboxyl carrier protein [Staphylococcus]VDG67014.1 biotin carboxyl carrier protein of acetyl-CoA carboxylase AccB [Lacrimispora indolis]ATH60007.1 acetyl-CoA carboxylase, biotin carboxyl carrier protein [Staphylococcus nepalensis]ATH65099.1 acetyl-CoA carboxylase, biotin carboxyl carrier protein [Staphylococcus nepalensis]AWI44465.1 acetyl-CoA carboxylase, biotin carboxyl carrier protein [Staphylococcus nepalensis]MBO1205035.1 acetyl-CoA carboxyl